MALQSVSIGKREVRDERVSLQQIEFDKAYGQQGYYVIIAWSGPFDCVDPFINKLYADTYPGSVYSHEDITSEGYLNMVQLIMSYFTGERVASHKDNYLYYMSLKWLPIEVIESNAWVYDRFTEDDPCPININYEKAELFQLKKQLRETAEHLRTILRDGGGDPLPLAEGLLQQIAEC